MKKILKYSTMLLVMNGLFFYTIKAADRESEIREIMWNSNNPDFSVHQIPEKWKKESAVIIAQFHGFQYKKPAILSKLYHNQYRHYRIMLNDKNAINHYAEIAFPNSDDKNHQVFIGLKLIKPDGREIIVDNTTAVVMAKEKGSEKRSYKKIAVPNLEPGDILDYYICEETVIDLLTKMYYFEPVLYHLPRSYPVMKQKIQFDVQRRCFISLKSLNGAPQLKVVYDQENDEQHYSLEDENREALDEMRWFYPYRELPAIKFRAAYASGKAVRTNDVLLGESGKVKSSVSEKELADFLAYIFINTYTDGKDIIKYVKRNTEKNSDYFTQAKAGYYFQRNQYLANDEMLTVADNDQWTSYIVKEKDNHYEFIDRFSHFLADRDIPYDIVIVVPRSISSLDDVLIEHELRFLLRVKQGEEYLYLSQIDNFSMPGDIDAMLEGADAYVVDGLEKFKKWDPKRITLPVSSEHDNMEETVVEVKIGEGFDQAVLAFQKSVSGKLKPYYQDQLLDFYDYIGSERDKFEMKESFAGTMWLKKKFENLKSSYLNERDKDKNDMLKFMLENNFDFEIKEASGFTLDQAGRFKESPELKYRFNATATGLIHKVGPNYTMDVGKLIEKQIKIGEEEIARENNVYMEHPRSYRYRILVDIPEGYEVQGLKSLNINAENAHGGFVSTAKVEDNKIIIESYKHYNKVFVKKEDWPMLVDFLNEANNFSQQKILFKKKKTS